MGSEVTNASESLALDRLQLASEKGESETPFKTASIGTTSQAHEALASAVHDECERDSNQYSAVEMRIPLPKHRLGSVVDMAVSAQTKSSSSSSVGLYQGSVYSPKPDPSLDAPSHSQRDYLTPPSGAHNCKNIVPSSAPTHYLEGSSDHTMHQALKGAVRSPLVNSSKHSSIVSDSEHSLLVEAEHQSFSGYGRPDEFVTPVGRGKRRSWRPKGSFGHKSGHEQISLSPKRDMGKKSSSPLVAGRNVRPPFTIGVQSSSHSTTSHDLSPGNKSHQSFCSEPVAEDWDIFATPESDGGRKLQSRRFPLAAPPLAAKDDAARSSQTKVHSRSPKRASDPAPVSRRTVKSLSPMPVSGRNKWRSNRVSDPKDLPPAFQAAHRASSHFTATSLPSKPPLSPKGRGPIDVSTLERVAPAPREKFLPSKLNRAWPPVAVPTEDTKPNADRLSFLRALGAITDTTFKTRRQAFEYDETAERDSAQSRPSSKTLTAVDLALHIVQGQSTDQASYGHTNNDVIDMAPSTNMMERVNEILNDKIELNTDIGTSTEVLMPHHDEEGTTCGEVLSNLKVQTSMKIRWGGPTYYDIEGWPLYYDGNYVDDHGVEQPFAPLIADRFGAGSADKGLRAPSRSRDSADISVTCPRRTYDDWSDDESWFSDEDIGTLEDERLSSPKQANSPIAIAESHRPAVWVASSGTLEGVEDEEWRVKRVWGEPSIDAVEPEHRVHNDKLMDKVKKLLGVSVDGSGVTPDYNPEAEHWHMKKVYDIEGEIHQASETMQVDENGISNGFREIARAASNSNVPNLSKSQEMEDIPEAFSPSIDPVVEDGIPSAELQMFGTKEPSTELVTEQNDRAETDSSHVKPAPSPTKGSAEEKGTRNGKKRRNTKKETTVWDLLSPPPVTFVVHDV